MPVVPAASRSEPAAESGPAVPRRPASARRRTAAAGLAVVAGVVALVALTAAYAVPVTLPVVGPVAVLLGAIALWSTARFDAIRIASDRDRLSDENRELSVAVEALADKAWELRETEERYRNLIAAREKAEAANRSKSRFLATVSHEFRTPLNGILGLTGLLLETSLTADQETYARGVQSSGEALLALVDDILDFSKIEAGRLDLRPEATDIEALIRDIVELLAARAFAKGIDIAADVATGMPARLVVDASRLRQVLLNLAGNGVKFTDSGGVTIEAAVEPAPPPTVRVAFTVSDTGPGVPPEEAERIFGEFEQADSALTRRHGGTGLGLAISRRLVRRMGGDICLAPREGGGSVFRFALDLAVAERAPPPSEPSLAGHRVLIVAPDGAEPPVLARQLGVAGATARVVATVNEAAALAGAATAASLAYDVVLIDRRTTSDAAAALVRLREAAGAAMPAAILIEPGRRSDIEALKAAGFDAYLVRPVRRASLLKIIGEIAGARGGFRADPGDARAPRTPVLRRAPQSLEILLAEDNEINALLVRAVLEQLGHTVTEVRDGAAAVRAATGEGKHFAAILMDLHMPGLDGLAAARAIRGHEGAVGGPRSAILALTADVLAETRVEAEAAGIDVVLQKPIAPDRLRRVLAELAA